MDTYKEYISFHLNHAKSTEKTKAFNVRGRTSQVYLGLIKFRPQWRKYVFEPEANTVYDHKCLVEIASFCEDQTKEWRATLKS